MYNFRTYSDDYNFEGTINNMLDFYDISINSYLKRKLIADLCAELDDIVEEEIDNLREELQKDEIKQLAKGGKK